jgi:hypothetical protein
MPTIEKRTNSKLQQPIKIVEKISSSSTNGAFLISPQNSSSSGILYTSESPTTIYGTVKSDRKPSSKKEKLLKRIREIAMHEDGWSGSDSLGASKQAVRNAEVFLNILFKGQLNPPSISLAEDGEIHFYWSTTNYICTLGFESTGCYTYYAETVSGKEVSSGEDVGIKMPLDEDLIKLLRD